MSERIFNTPAPAKATPEGPAFGILTHRSGYPVFQAERDVSVRHVPNSDARQRPDK